MIEEDGRQRLIFAPRCCRRRLAAPLRSHARFARRIGSPLTSPVSSLPASPASATHSQSLALSARCYHARAHGRTKDTCRFVCENDPDGLVLATLEGQPFLVANGVQTLSWEYLNLAQEIPALKAAGVTRFRLSPHSCDMVQVATTFRCVLDGALSVEEALARLAELPLEAPFSNGFHHGRPGHGWTTLTGASTH
jgi:collagenase-like PrtC family protease